MRFWLGLLLAVAPCPVSADGPDARTATLESLFAAFRELPGLSARFREEKRLALLEAPLSSEGVVYFAPPDHLARLQETPEASTLLLVGDALTMRSAGATQRLDVASQPLAAALVQSFRAVLAGDLETLRRLHSIELEPLPEGGPAPGSAGSIPPRWAVTLEPLDAALARVIDRIEIRGRAAQVLELVLVEASGDTTTMRFSAVDTTRRFSPEERRALFQLEP